MSVDAARSQTAKRKRPTLQVKERLFARVDEGGRRTRMLTFSPSFGGVTLTMRMVTFSTWSHSTPLWFHSFSSSGAGGARRPHSASQHSTVSTSASWITALPISVNEQDNQLASFAKRRFRDRSMTVRRGRKDGAQRGESEAVRRLDGGGAVRHTFSPV